MGSVISGGDYSIHCPYVSPSVFVGEFPQRRPKFHLHILDTITANPLSFHLTPLHHLFSCSPHFGDLPHAASYHNAQQSPKLHPAPQSHLTSAYQSLAYISIYPYHQYTIPEKLSWKSVRL